MIPVIPDYDGYVVGPNGEQLRTPLQQIEKNKDDINNLFEWKDKIVETDLPLLLEQVRNAILNKLDIPANVPDGNLVKWDANDSKLVDAGFSIETASQLILSEFYKVPIDAYIHVDYVGGDVITTEYKHGKYVAKGWHSFANPMTATMTGVPREIGARWYQKICNASNYNQTLCIKDAILFNNTITTLSGSNLGVFTDKVVECRNQGTDLYVTVAPKSSVFVQCQNRPTGYSQISIT